MRNTSEPDRNVTEVSKIFTGKLQIWPWKPIGICGKVRIRVMVEFMFGILGEKMLYMFSRMVN